jgi:hypothetical protein
MGISSGPHFVDGHHFVKTHGDDNNQIHHQEHKIIVSSIRFSPQNPTCQTKILAYIDPGITMMNPSAGRIASAILSQNTQVSKPSVES